jgi:hypothetical protein
VIYTAAAMLNISGLDGTSIERQATRRRSRVKRKYQTLAVYIILFRVHDQRSKARAPIHRSSKLRMAIERINTRHSDEFHITQLLLLRLRVHRSAAYNKKIYKRKCVHIIDLYVWSSSRQHNHIGNNMVYHSCNSIHVYLLSTPMPAYQMYTYLQSCIFVYYSVKAFISHRQLHFASTWCRFCHQIKGHDLHSIAWLYNKRDQQQSSWSKRYLIRYL